MESLLRAVLTSSDNLGTLSNSSQSKRDIKLANPHLHAALTSAQLKPRPAMKLTKSAVEQPPSERTGEKRPCQPYQKAPSRHSKLLEALISGANHPPDNNLQSSTNPDSNGLKVDKNSKKPEALHKSRLFMALTSPMVSLDNWSHQDNHNLISQPEIRPAKGKANGIGPQDLRVNLRSISSQNVSNQDNPSSIAIKTEQATKGDVSTAKSSNFTDKSRTAFNGNSNSFEVDSQTPVLNCNNYKKTHTANPTKVRIKSETQSEIVDNTDSSWENIQDQNKMVSTNELEYNMDIDEGFDGGIDSGESRGSEQNNASDDLSECLTIKKECQAEDEDESFMEYPFICDPQVKVEPGNSYSLTSDNFSSVSAIGANISTKSPKLLAANHRQEAESSNLCTILQSTPKRKNSDPLHSSLLINKDDRVASVPCKRRKMLIEKNSVNRKNTHIDLFETDLDGPVPNREAGIFQKKSNTDAQILRRVLTEGIGELRGRTNSQQSVASSPKSFASSKIKERQHSAANLSPPSGSLVNPNKNQPEKNPIKSQILRAALTAVEPIVPIRKPNSESHSPSRLKISSTAIKTEISSSGSNAIPPLCSNPPDNTDRSSASAVKNSGEKISSVFGNSDGQDSMKTAAAEDRPQKTKCQLLLAALTASDNSKISNLLNANESAPKQTSSEILRAALNNAEKDSQGIGAKHSQLLRAALTAVDTNKAAKSWHQTNTKLTNSRLLRAVLTGKYIPDTVDHTDYSKVTHRKGPMSCNLNESKNEFSVSNTKLGTVTRSYDLVEITPNLGATATKKDKVQKVSPSGNGSTRSGSNSILRAVLTGAIDISHRAHESTKNNNVKHPELIANANENRTGTKVISSCYSTNQDKKVKSSNNNNRTQPLSSSSSSSLSSASESGCKEQCCEYCGKYHSRGDSLWEYTSQFAGDTPHSCYMCNQSFSFACLFLDHMETHTDISSKYKCEFCGRHFKHVLSYIMCRLSHIDAQKEEEEEKISCNLCNCEFTCHNKLRQHTRIHAKDRFTCKFCGKEFHQRINCYLHERDHVDNKMNFTCKMCGEKFELASDLKAHHQTHYAAELFKCSRCIKCFVTPKALKLHEKTHIPVDHQGDTECNKKVFMQSDDHQCGNSREKRKFLCDGCGLICTSRYSLAKHKATCGGLPYTDKKFQVDMVSHSLVAIKD